MSLPIIMGAWNVVSSGLQLKARNEAIAAQSQAMGEYAVADARSKMQRANLRANQESKAITLEQIRRARQGARERANISVAIAESGLYGGSQQRAEIASIIQEAEDISVLEENREMMIEQTEATKKGIEAEATTRVSQAQDIAKSAPSGLSMGLTLFGEALSGYSMGERLQFKGTGTFRKSPSKVKPKGKGMFEPLSPITM